MADRWGEKFWGKKNLDSKFLSICKKLHQACKMFKNASCCAMIKSRNLQKSTSVQIEIEQLFMSIKF